MTARRLYPESGLPMTAAEYAIFTDAYAKNLRKNLTKTNYRELAQRAGENAVKRSRGRILSAAERTLDMFEGR